MRKEIEAGAEAVCWCVDEGDRSVGRNSVRSFGRSENRHWGERGTLTLNSLEVVELETSLLVGKMHYCIQHHSSKMQCINASVLKCRKSSKLCDLKLDDGHCKLLKLVVPDLNWVFLFDCFYWYLMLMKHSYNKDWNRNDHKEYFCELYSIFNFDPTWRKLEAHLKSFYCQWRSLIQVLCSSMNVEECILWHE